MRVLGMISGTSHDGIDVAVVGFTDTDGVLEAKIEYAASVPYDPVLRARIIAALPPAPVGFDVVCELDALIGQAFASAAADSLEKHAALVGTGPVDAICSHGQTVFHWVHDRRALGTLQLGQPAWITETTGLPVISDVRAADIAAGGHGAPLVPILDTHLLATYATGGRCAAALNLGGIANITVCASGADPIAWDIGPANALVDAVVTEASSGADTFDSGGDLARAGKVIQPLLDEFLREPYYELEPPKSSGKELFHLGYVRATLDRVGAEPSLPDLAATLTELTAATVAQAVNRFSPATVVASGGGVRNRAIMDRIRDRLPGVEVVTTDALGVPSDEKEAVAFALIGWATLHGLPSSVPSCTGASGPRVLGRVTPGLTGSLAMSTRATWPTKLEFTSTRERST